MYDVHGRLKTVITPNGSDETITHNVYDDAGNRVSVISFLASTPPDPPTGVTASAVASDRIEVNWTPSLDAGGGAVSYYRVYRDGPLLASPTVPPLADATVAPNTAYSYRVSAVDAVGHESAQSVAANATTPPDTTDPTAPANLSGTAVSDTQVNLGWSASQDMGGSGLAGYEILRGAGSTPIGTSSSTSFSDQSASSGTTYSYRVRAYDWAGNRSDDSNQIWVTTPDTVAPGAPGNPAFSSVTLETAVADWSAASDNVAVTGYRYSLNGGGSWTEIPNVTSTFLSGLQYATPYTMWLQARDAAGNWGPSSSGSFTTASSYIVIASGARPPIVLPEHTATYACGYFIDEYYFIEYEYCDVINGGNVFYVSYYPPQGPWLATGYTWGDYLTVDSNYYGTY